MRRIAIVNQKGGSGKTTTATALAVGLAKRGKTVLLVDCDAQANATWTLLGGQEPEGPTLSSVLLKQADIEDAIRPTATEGLDVLPADSWLSGVNVALVQEMNRDVRLRSALAPLNGRWDFVVLDTAPTFTTILANALVYAAEVLVPVDAGVYAVLGLVQIQETIAEVRETYQNHELHLSGLLLTRTTRSNVCRDVANSIRERFGNLVFEATVPQSAKIEEAHTRGQTVLDWSPRSSGAVAYNAFVTEVLDGRSEKRGGLGTDQRAARDDAA